MIQGIIYSCQYLVITAGEPNLAGEIMIQSGYSMKALLKEQKATGYETRKMNAAIRDAFRRESLKK